MTKLEEAHARAVVALLNTIPKCSEEEAEEIVESFTALVLYTIHEFLPGDNNDQSRYN
jgi:hypothetical protein